MLQPIEASSLARLPGIRHGFFTRVGGVSEGLYAEPQLRAGLVRCGGERCREPRPRRPPSRRQPSTTSSRIYQVHSGDCARHRRARGRARAPQGRRVVTRTPGLVIGILTADCAPVLFADPRRGVVGAAHAGWRGAVGGVSRRGGGDGAAGRPARSHIAAPSGRPLTKFHTKSVQTSRRPCSKVAGQRNVSRPQ